MKPAWDKLMAEYDGNKDALVADVDCTSDGGKAVCSENGVQGYPTIKWGDPSNLEDYQGGRDFDALKKFADENLKPVCSPSNLELCDDDKKAQIEGFMAMSAEDLDAAIAEKEAGIKDANGKFDEELKALQANYEKLVEEKDSAVAEIKKSGLGLMKAVKAAK
jgi:hypothetical protein